MTRKLVLAGWFVGATIAAAFLATSAIAFVAIFSATARAQPDIPLPPDDATQKQIIADVKAKALDYEKNLPDFTCTQLSHHSLDLKGTAQWKTLETVSETLRFIHHVEEYTLIAQNGKKASGSEKRPAGLISIKEFSDMLHYLFDPAVKIEMAWQQWDSVRGHRVHKLIFGVPKATSLFTVKKSKDLKSGLAGFAYVDSDTNAVLRLEMAATDIPKTNPVQAEAMDIVYDFARIGDKIYLLPFKADLHEKQGKTQVWDEVELKDFRKP